MSARSRLPGWLSPVSTSVRHSGSRSWSGSAAVSPSSARQVDVQHGDVGLGAQRGADDLVAALQLGHDLHVVLQREQRDQRAADHVHVLGDQDADHADLLGDLDPQPEPAVTDGVPADTEPDERSSPAPIRPASPVPSPDGVAARRR